jgi:hypothetical protein
MLKKMMLLAMAVGALIALAGPATASASPELEWETGETTIGSTTASGDEVHFTGTLTSTKGALKISCEATANVRLWNDPTLGAHGEVNSLTLTSDPVGTAGCTVAVNTGSGYVDVANCHVDASTKGYPWTVTTSVSGANHHVTIDNAQFTNKFTGAGCATIGIPNNTEVSDSGNATGVATSNGDCINFSNAGTFVGGSTIDGELCATGDLRLTTLE